MWPLNPRIDLATAGRVSDQDARRQLRTAQAILDAMADQPGVVLADEVGMGKTYVALAVATSVLEATSRANPVVILVPTAVAEKWSKEWQVFSEHCLPPGHGLRGFGPVKHASELLKLLDDPPETRQHLIFATHTALNTSLTTSTLTDRLILLALLRQATRYDRDHQDRHRQLLARHAGALLNDRRRFADEEFVATLLDKPPARWKDIWNQWRDDPLDDDPVPKALLDAVARTDLSSVRQAIGFIPQRDSPTFNKRLSDARTRITEALKEVWSQSMRQLDVRLPLLILDEAHHVRNRTQLSGLFANTDERGALGSMFDRMLFLTATPFQLNHDELIRILRRFDGVRWSSQAARERFDEQLVELGDALNRSRAAALRLERAWARLDESDGTDVACVTGFEIDDAQSERVRTAVQAAAAAHDQLRVSEKLLRPWVIRHTRHTRTQRRDHRPGQAIRDGGDPAAGLTVDGEAVLPFLLAARAEAIASLSNAATPNPVRGYYAYGLASSFEAYADTRARRTDNLDDIDTPDDSAPAEPTVAATQRQLRWYVERIKTALPHDTADGWAAHPKVAATVSRVLDLWRSGEKALVFCFYRETSRALRNHISRALEREIIERAARALGRPAEHGVLDEVESIAERLLRSDAKGYDAFRERIASYLNGLDIDTAEQAMNVAVRFMRTPSFLTRYVSLTHDLTIDSLLAGLDRGRPGNTFADHIRAFADVLTQQVDAERSAVLDALTSIQTGGIRVTGAHFDASERSHAREVLLPNVRLVNGETRQDVRQTLMQTFNTPFFPEVLIASSVMAEGVDLHHACRHVIHHDLDWNPSALEQRTGRVDRIGSRAARLGQPVVVYEPYLGGTHDEKDVPGRQGPRALVRHRHGRNARHIRVGYRTASRSHPTPDRASSCPHHGPCRSGRPMIARALSGLARQQRATPDRYPDRHTMATRPGVSDALPGTPGHRGASPPGPPCRPGTGDPSNPGGAARPPTLSDSIGAHAASAVLTRSWSPIVPAASE